MILHDFPQLLECACKVHKKWGIFLQLGPCEVDQFDDVELAVPWIHEKGSISHFLAYGWQIILFDTEEETYEHYKVIRGDDENHFNTYQGPIKVYALTCTPDGECWNENT
jgi:hypothetical protein